MSSLVELFPDTAALDDGELSVGGIRLSDLAAEHGTPLVVYDEATILSAVQAYRAAAPEALLVYGVKAFPNAAVLRLLADEGVGADVSTLGELELALRAGVPGERLVVHGNNKSDEELAAAAGAEASFVVVDALDEVERAAQAGVRRILVRVTPGVEADTHPSIRTAHEGSKFGLPPEDALEALGRAREAGLETAGVHVHVGSQLMDARAGLATVDWIADFSVRCRDELGWTPGVVDLGGGLGIQYVEGKAPQSIEDFVGELLGRVSTAWAERDLPAPGLVLEPGRSLVGRAGVTVYEVGVVKRVARRHDVRGCRRGHVGQPPAAALRRRVQRPPGESGGRGAVGELRRLRQALRVGGRDDPRPPTPRSAARRPARRARHGRVRTVDGVQLQRRPAAGGGAGRERQRAVDQKAGNDRRRAPSRRSVGARYAWSLPGA